MKGNNGSGKCTIVSASDHFNRKIIHHTIIIIIIITVLIYLDMVERNCCVCGETHSFRFLFFFLSFRLKFCILGLIWIEIKIHIVYKIYGKVFIFHYYQVTAFLCLWNEVLHRSFSKHYLCSIQHSRKIKMIVIGI